MIYKKICNVTNKTESVFFYSAIAIALLEQNISVFQNEASAALCGISPAKMNVPQHILLRTPRISLS